MQPDTYIRVSDLKKFRVKHQTVTKAIMEADDGEISYTSLPHLHPTREYMLWASEDSENNYTGIFVDEAHLRLYLTCITQSSLECTALLIKHRYISPTAIKQEQLGDQLLAALKSGDNYLPLYEKYWQNHGILKVELETGPPFED
jgi:hypothetical protein